MLTFLGMTLKYSAKHYLLMFPYCCTVLVRMSVNQMDAQPFLLRRENNMGQCSLICEN